MLTDLVSVSPLLPAPAEVLPTYLADDVLMVQTFLAGLANASVNTELAYRKELEGSIRSYFKIFTTTSQHVRSFRKYEERLSAVGIKLPESIRGKIQRYLQGGEKEPPVVPTV